MKILVSACLLGVRCRYDGTGELRPDIGELSRRHQLIPVCPEILGGLPTPRCPAERVGNRVMTREGRDVTAEYRRGAEEALGLARLFACPMAVLKERSPSCGSGRIYDGTFSGVQTDGDGVTAERLKREGIIVAGETGYGEILSLLERSRREDLPRSGEGEPAAEGLEIEEKN